MGERDIGMIEALRRAPLRDVGIDITRAGLAANLDLVRSSKLTDVASFDAVIAREALGSPVIDLVGRPGNGTRAWHFTLRQEEAPDQLQQRLRIEHARWTTLRDAVETLCGTVEQHARDFLAARASAAQVADCGVGTPGRNRMVPPLAVLTVACLGRDGIAGVDRIAMAHDHDLATELERIVARDARAREVASRWAAIGAKAEIDAAAASIAAKCGLGVSDILEKLSERAELPFDCRALGMAGAFTWSDIGVVVRVERGRPWSLDGDVLTLPATPVPDTLAFALVGGPLTRLIEIEELPQDLVIDDIALTGGVNLAVKIRRMRLPIGSRGEIGRP